MPAAPAIIGARLVGLLPKRGKSKRGASRIGQSGTPTPTIHRLDNIGPKSPQTKPFIHPYKTITTPIPILYIWIQHMSIFRDMYLSLSMATARGKAHFTKLPKYIVT